LVGVDAEVAEFAALAAKRNVQVQAQRRAGLRRVIQDGVGVGQKLWLPGGEGRVVGDEVITEAGLFLRGVLYVRTRRHGADTFGWRRAAVRGVGQNSFYFTRRCRYCKQ